MLHQIGLENGKAMAAAMNEAPHDLQRVARIIAAYTGIEAEDVVFVEEPGFLHTVDGQTNVSALCDEGAWTVGIAVSGDTFVF